MAEPVRCTLHLRIILVSVKFRDLPLVFYSEGPDAYDQQDGENLYDGIRQAGEFRQQEKSGASYNTCRSIDFLPENQRDPVQQDIADDSPEAARNGSQADTDQRVDACMQSFLDADNREQSQPEAVENKKGDPEVFFKGLENHRKDAGEDNQAAGQQVMHPEYRDIQEQVPYRSSADRGNKGNDQYPERIQPFLHRRKASRHRKRYRPKDFYGKVELFVHF